MNQINALIGRTRNLCYDLCFGGFNLLDVRFFNTVFSVISRSKHGTQLFTPSKGNSFNSSSISPFNNIPSCFVHCCCSAHRHSISFVNVCSAIFSSRANFSAFFLKNEHLLEAVDSLDVNSHGVGLLLSEALILA